MAILLYQGRENTCRMKDNHAVTVKWIWLFGTYFEKSTRSSERLLDFLLDLKRWEKPTQLKKTNTPILK